MTLHTLQWIYRCQPYGVVGPEHYELIKMPVSEALGSDDVLVAGRYFSVDPYMRINQARRRTWADPHPLDTVQAGAIVGQVIDSRSGQFCPGDWVSAYTGWQTHAIAPASQLTKLDTTDLDPSTALGVLGMPGRTAWFGLTEAGRPRAGDTVVVSGAAGAVGSLVVQFAKRHGARVIGIAGGAAKCAWVRDGLGADIALDYHLYSDADALGDALADAADGVDVYFDNVGGYISDAVLARINRRARIVICGQISQYSGGLDTPPLGPRLMHHVLYQRATIQGILARDYVHRMDEMLRTVGPWVRRGEILFEETRIQGFENLPNALNSLFTGDHRGKMIVCA